MDVLFGTAHLSCPTPACVGQCEQVKEPVIYQPRQRNDLVGWVRLFQQVRRSPVVANKGSYLFSNTEVATQIPKPSATNLHADESVLGRVRPPGGRVGGGRVRLTSVVK